MDIDTSETRNADMEDDIKMNDSLKNTNYSRMGKNGSEWQESSTILNKNDEINGNKDNKNEENVLLSIKSIPELQVQCWREEKNGMFNWSCL